MPQCLRCDCELDFEPLCFEAFDYQDALCDACFRDMERDDNEDDNWCLTSANFTDDDFAVASELYCD